MECYEVKECYSEYVDECLGDKRRMVEEHISVCPVCNKQAQRIRCVVEAVQCLPQEEASPDFLVRLNERLDCAQSRWDALWESLRSFNRAQNLVAAAATLVLAALIGVYISNKGMSGGNDLVAIEYQPIHATESAHSPLMPAAVLTEPDRRSADPFTMPDPIGLRGAAPSPIRRVAFGASPAPTGTRVFSPAPRAPTETSPFPDMRLLGAIPSPTPRKVPYFDKVVLVRSPNPSATGDEIRKAVASLSGLHKDYSNTIIFTRLESDKTTPFLQALENMGDIEVITGPIDRGLSIVEIQVIVIPDANRSPQ